MQKNFCKLIAKTKIMTAKQIVKNEDGKEVVLSFGEEPGQSKLRVPRYLDDDDETSKQEIPDKVFFNFYFLCTYSIESGGNTCDRKIVGNI